MGRLLSRYVCGGRFCLDSKSLVNKLFQWKIMRNNILSESKTVVHKTQLLDNGKSDNRGSVLNSLYQFSGF